MATPTFVVLPAGAYTNKSNDFMWVYGNDTVTMTDESSNQVDIDNLPTWLPPNFTLTPTNNTERLIAVKAHNLEDFRGFLSSQFPPAATVNNPPPAGQPIFSSSTAAVSETTTSTSVVMMGFGANAVPFTYTPTLTGTLVIYMSGLIADTIATDLLNIAQFRSGTGSAPANGAALTGTQQKDGWPTSLVFTAPDTGNHPFSAVIHITGLTKGTAYWFDWAASVGAGGSTGTIQISWVIREEGS